MRFFTLLKGWSIYFWQSTRQQFSHSREQFLTPLWHEICGKFRGCTPTLLPLNPPLVSRQFGDSELPPFPFQLHAVRVYCPLFIAVESEKKNFRNFILFENLYSPYNYLVILLNDNDSGLFGNQYVAAAMTIASVMGRVLGKTFKNCILKSTYQWRSNRVCRVCNEHGPGVVGGPVFSSNVECIIINSENHWLNYENRICSIRIQLVSS